MLFERYHLFIGIGIVAKYSNEIILFTEATPVQMINRCTFQVPQATA